MRADYLSEDPRTREKPIEIIDAIRNPNTLKDFYKTQEEKKISEGIMGYYLLK